MTHNQPILDVLDLSIRVARDKDSTAVEQISFNIHAGEVFGMVGESGCGKSLCALAIAGLLRPPLSVSGGQVLFEGRDLLTLPTADMRQLRGGRIAMIFQEPMSALNPLMSIGDQIGEMFMLHHGLNRTQAQKRAITALEQVHVPSPAKRIHDYPHHLSGGMRQRIMIAIALACDPALLIADEPTTALDVTIQAEITDLILDLCRQKGTAVLMISHDLGHVSDICDRVAVMYAGRIVEERRGAQVFTQPRHPYARGLVAALPKLGRRLSMGQHRLIEIPGIVPPIGQRPPGCHFAPRCPRVLPDCRLTTPFETLLPDGGKVRCLYHDED